MNIPPYISLICIVIIAVVVAVYTVLLKNESKKLKVAESDLADRTEERDHQQKEILSVRESYSTATQRVADLTTERDGLQKGYGEKNKLVVDLRAELDALKPVFTAFALNRLKNFPQCNDLDTKAIAAQSGKNLGTVRRNLASGTWTGRKVYDESRMTWVMRKRDVPVAPPTESDDA